MRNWLPPWREPTALDVFGFRLLRIIKAAFGLRRTYVGLGYHGFLASKGGFIVGRVCEALPPKITQETGTFGNAWSLLRRFSRARGPKARVALYFDNDYLQTETDGTGYFSFNLKAIPIDQVSEPRVKLIGTPDHLEDLDRYTKVPMTRVHPKIPLVVVSDIDDTIIQSHAMDFVRSIKVALATNARSREAVLGMSQFYGKLSRFFRSRGEGYEPAFCYVTSSSWSLYEFLSEVLRLNQFPAGPLLMQALGLTQNKLISTRQHSHKLDKIRALLGLTAKTVPFILIGDSGQHDRQIYEKIARSHKDRIAAIFIRHVPGTAIDNPNQDCPAPLFFFKDGEDLDEIFFNNCQKLWEKLPH